MRITLLHLLIALSLVATGVHGQVPEPAAPAPLSPGVQNRRPNWNAQGPTPVPGLNQLRPEPPPGWAAPPVAAAPGPEGLPQLGYQFEYGTFIVTPGNPPTIHGSFALKNQRFPNGPSKLYSLQLTYLGYNPGGPFEGAAFECNVDGFQRYFLFGTATQGVQQGVEFRQIRYFNHLGAQTFATTARFYSP